MLQRLNIFHRLGMPVSILANLNERVENNNVTMRGHGLDICLEENSEKNHKI